MGLSLSCLEIETVTKGRLEVGTVGWVRVTRSKVGNLEGPKNPVRKKELSCYDW